MEIRLKCESDYILTREIKDFFLAIDHMKLLNRFLKILLLIENRLICKYYRLYKKNKKDLFVPFIVFSECNSLSEKRKDYFMVIERN